MWGCWTNSPTPYFPLNNPSNRVFTLCREPKDDRRVLQVARPSDAEIAFRRAYFDAHQHYCGRAWYILHRSVCEALVRFFEFTTGASILPAEQGAEH